MASVTGSVTRKVVPSPARLSTSMTPESPAMLVFTTSRPTPRPDIALTVEAVENPGLKSTACSSRSPAARARSSSSSPRWMATSRTRAQSTPPPSSVSASTTRLPSCSAERRMRPARGFPASLPQPRRLDAVVDGVADQVHQRIAQLLHQALVDLHLGAGGGEHHLLARLARHPPDEALHPVEQRAERHHPRLEQPVLEDVQPPHQPPLLPEQLPRPGPRRQLARIRQAADGLTDEPQLAHVVHERVQPGDVHPERPRRPGRLGRLPRAPASVGLSGGPAFLADGDGPEVHHCLAEGDPQARLPGARPDEQDERERLDAVRDRHRGAWTPARPPRAAVP